MSGSQAAGSPHTSRYSGTSRPNRSRMNAWWSVLIATTRSDASMIARVSVRRP